MHVYMYHLQISHWLCCGVIKLGIDIEGDKRKYWLKFGSWCGYKDVWPCKNTLLKTKSDEPIKEVTPSSSQESFQLFSVSWKLPLMRSLHINIFWCEKVGAPR